MAPVGALLPVGAHARVDAIRLPPIATRELSEPELRDGTRAGGYGTEGEAIRQVLGTPLLANAIADVRSRLHAW